MSDPLLHPEETDVPRPRRRWVSVASYGLALALLGLCIWKALEQGSEGPRSGWQILTEADPVDAAWMGVLVLISILLNGWMFELVLRPFRLERPVGLARMSGLVAATSLLNYLPMRAGMIGRVAYLKKQHGVGYAASLIQLLFVAGCTVCVYGLMAGLAIWQSPDRMLWWVGLAVATPILATAVWAGLMVGERWAPSFARRWFEDGDEALRFCRSHAIRSWVGVCLILVLRVADAGTVVGRLWLATRILQIEGVGGSQLVLMATGGMFVRIATPLPNGLGLQEWVVGLMHESGLRLQLVDRSVEAVVFIATGLGAIFWLHRESRPPRDLGDRDPDVADGQEKPLNPSL